MDGYELKEENLLTYDEFQDVFEHEKLQVSLCSIQERGISRTACSQGVR